jgi:hypothetical protein
VRVRLSGLINGRNQFNSWGFPQAPYSGPGLCRTSIMKSSLTSLWAWVSIACTVYMHEMNSFLKVLKISTGAFWMSADCFTIFDFFLWGKSTGENWPMSAEESQKKKIWCSFLKKYFEFVDFTKKHVFTRIALPTSCWLPPWRNLKDNALSSLHALFRNRPGGVVGSPLTQGGHKEMSSILTDHLRPRIWALMRGGGVAGSQAMCTAVVHKEPE